MKVKGYFEKLKRNPKGALFFLIFWNKYMLIIFLFIIWMLFLDTNSWLIHSELNREIDKLEKNTRYYQKEIHKDQDQIKLLQDSTMLEKFAREKYFLKRDNEEIFIIEYQDSTSNEKQ